MRRRTESAWGMLVIALFFGAASSARAIGDETAFDARRVLARGQTDPRPTAASRLAWEVRKRTSVSTRLEPTHTFFDDPSIFETPFLYWIGEAPLGPLSQRELVGLRRFLELGGFLFVDDVSGNFAAYAKREIERAIPAHPFAPVPQSHTLFRSFYLMRRPVGRIEGPSHFEGLTLGSRLAAVVSQHDVSGALSRGNLGAWEFDVTPGGDVQREMAIRMAVNIVLYALCLDYKDDQVHAPFIMRRRGGAP